MKYLLIFLAGAALVWWWWAQRRALIRDQTRRDAQLTTELQKCPKCDAHVVMSEHSCG